MPIPKGTLVERVSLREAALIRIRAAIFDNTLEPGERLHDHQLQSWLGVSRTPVREALNDLARVGLIEMSAQRFTRVATPEPDSQAELGAALFSLLCAGIPEAIPDLDTVQRSRLMEALDDVAAAGMSPARFRQAFVQFATHLADSVPNQFLSCATSAHIEALAYRFAVCATTSGRFEAVNEASLATLKSALATNDPAFIRSSLYAFVHSVA
ncbi:GntR family transcriptional regulator [Plantibacter sp. YIM 135249]|uniref:GntR family transcriptional regulator n=1 Tax=Plantibacter sp. YIM 135249 TaxID=3423918 RepID=UPI003D33525E